MKFRLSRSDSALQGLANDNNQATDTVQKTLTVISGQKEISIGEGNIVYPIAIYETASGDFLLLGSTGWDAGYFLMQLDSLFQQKGQPKYLPASYRLTSMKPTNDALSDGGLFICGCPIIKILYNLFV